MKNRKAVIIDDDPLALAYLKRVLQRRGYEVEAYSDPVLAPLHQDVNCPCALHPNCPAVIISDVDMPSVNGVALLELIMKKGCRCRNLALISGKGMEHADLIRMAKYGTRYFTKPLDLTEFNAWIDRIDKDVDWHPVIPA
ncbi:MAG: response regulator [bacterium]